MNSAKFNSEVSVTIVNSSHTSIDDVTAVLKQQIDSGQRPHIASLNQHDILQTSEPQTFLREFIDKQLKNIRVTEDRLKRINDFNQLDYWNREVATRKDKKKRISSGMKNQLSASERDSAQRTIIDFPPEYEAVKLYLILFDVFDCDLIKTVIGSDSSLKAIVNLYPRSSRSEAAIKSEQFWDELLQVKHSKAFNNVAFLDLDVPVESQYMLNLRSKLIYDQFSHFCYDIEDIKASFGKFSERLQIVDVGVADARNDLDELTKQLDEIPQCMLSVELIYEALVEQVSKESRKSSQLKLTQRKPLQVKVFGKKFADVNDAWRDGFKENPNVYTAQVVKLEESLHFWDGVESVSVDERQLLNHFMAKLATFDYFEFYVYVLQFEAMKSSSDIGDSKTFFEDRSVGRPKEAATNELKHAASDYHVDYKNRSNIPEEIAQLVDDERHDSNQTLQASLFSPTAMSQHLSALMKSQESFTKLHCKLLDVMLVKFHKLPVPQLFTTKTYKKVLPTPLCFRDYSDFAMHEMKLEDELKVATNEDGFAEGEICLNGFKSEDFVLQTSLKRQAMGEQNNDEAVKIPSEKPVDVKTVEKGIQVFDVSNKRVQFHLIESEFHSSHITARASSFDWLHEQQDINFSCELHDALLTISHDAHDNLVSMSDSNGLKCCFEVSRGEPHRNFTTSLPNGIAMKHGDNGAVEQCWRDDEFPDAEAKRVLFPNGFMMIVFADGGKRVHGWNGVVCEADGSSKGVHEHDKEATKLHQHAIQLLQDVIGSPSFKMTTPSGEIFIVERGLIVDKLNSIRSVEKRDKTGNLHVVRGDGMEFLYTEAFSKCSFPDGTLITTWHRDDSIATNADEEAVNSILNEIWCTESQIESKFVVNRIMSHITDDYFVNVTCRHQFEHVNYGAIYFNDGKTRFKLINDVQLEAASDQLLMTLQSGVTFELEESHIRMTSVKCSECSRSCEAFMSLQCDGGESDVHVAICDPFGNTFEIKKNGRHVFYDNNDTYGARPCSQCKRVKNNYEAEKFGEHCIILNRDGSGYEVMNGKLPSKPFSVTANEVLSIEKSNRYAINDEDVHIEAQNETTAVSEFKAITSPSMQSKISSETVTSLARSSTQSKKKRRKSSKSLEGIQPSIELIPSPWMSQNQSIPEDITAELQTFIRFYENPLSDLPDSSAVSVSIRLNDGKFKNVIAALQHLKNYSSEKFILKACGLSEAPVGKKTFEENFKLAVRKALESHITEKVETHRRRLAGEVIYDLLDMVLRSEEEVKFEMEISSETTAKEEKSDSRQPPVAVKAFSFS